MKRTPQVSHEHYKLENYVTHERWQSYFNQVREVLRYNPKTVLVIGPGDGIVVNILKGYKLDVTTVDIDVANEPDIIASVEDLKGSGNMPEVKYDVVLCSQVLEHLPYETFERTLRSIKEYTGKVTIISLPEKSFRASLILKLPKLKPLFFNFVVPFLFKKHRFDGEHYWELNSSGYSVKKVVNDINKVFPVKKYYRLNTNPYHYFFIVENIPIKKIFFLSDGGNPHTYKWVSSLAKQNYEIYLFGLTDFNSDLYKEFPNVQTFNFGFDHKKSKQKTGAWNKLSYLKSYWTLRNKVKEFEPHIVHSHFASSYGLLGALLFHKCYFISVWGADVYDFPERGFFHRLLLRFNLWRANKVFSTSHVMAKQTQKFTGKNIQVIPFGLSTDFFQPEKYKRVDQTLTIGTVKSMEEKYGIKYLLEAFAILKKRIHNIPLKLLVVGRGTQAEALKKYAEELGIGEHTTFTGWIPVQDIPYYHQQIDIAVFPSILDSESFGVAVIEASAMEKPVIVSRKGGLIEVVKDEESGLIVEAKNPEAIADALERLIKDPELRKKLGKAGRSLVMKNYEWNHNLKDMIEIYEKVFDA